MNLEAHSLETAKVPVERERRLILAILEEAVRSYQRYAFATNRRGRRLFWETCEWFAESDEPWVFSFENICHALDLETDSIRQGLTRWRQTHIPRQTTAPQMRMVASGYRLRRAAG
jgi:hypothetical protein